MKRKEKLSTEKPPCENCGGIHFGSIGCPFTKAPCVGCGTDTIFACSDCQIDGRTVHVCGALHCRVVHEKIHEKVAKQIGPRRKGRFGK